MCLGVSCVYVYTIQYINSLSWEPLNGIKRKNLIKNKSTANKIPEIVPNYLNMGCASSSNNPLSTTAGGGDGTDVENSGNSNQPKYRKYLFYFTCM